jgi:hypothetical protein
MVDSQGRITTPWLIFFQTLLPIAETQTAASGDPTPKADFDDFINKLQAAGMME